MRTSYPPGIHCAGTVSRSSIPGAFLPSGQFIPAVCRSGTPTSFAERHSSPTASLRRFIPAICSSIYCRQHTLSATARPCILHFAAGLCICFCGDFAAASMQRCSAGSYSPTPPGRSTGCSFRLSSLLPAGFRCCCVKYISRLNPAISPFQPTMTVNRGRVPGSKVCFRSLKSVR